MFTVNVMDSDLHGIDNQNSVGVMDSWSSSYWLPWSRPDSGPPLWTVTKLAWAKSGSSATKSSATCGTGTEEGKKVKIFTTSIIIFFITLTNHLVSDTSS